jgi:hypothetical protein
MAPESDFAGLHSLCPFRVLDKDRAITFNWVKVLAPEAHGEMFHFCIKRGSPGFLDAEGLNTLSGFGLPGDPCSEAFCFKVWAGRPVEGGARL